MVTLIEVVHDNFSDQVDKTIYICVLSDIVGDRGKCSYM